VYVRDGNVVTAPGVVKVSQLRDMHLLNLFDRGVNEVDTSAIRAGLRVWDINRDEPLHQDGGSVYSLGNGRQLFEEPGAGALEQWSRMQLLLALDTAGWTRTEVPNPKKVDPHIRGGTKTYYMKPDGDGGVFAVYLRCLLNVDTLFAKGLQSLFHGQIKAYYNAVEGLSFEYLRVHGLPPNKSVKFYNAVLKGLALPDVVEDDGFGLPGGVSSSEGEEGDPPVPSREVRDTWMRPRMTATLLTITMRCVAIRYDTMRYDTRRVESIRYDTILYESLRRELLR
jgi:hypothetical protein